IVTGASASGQLLAAGTLERRAAPERPTASRAPLAALAFVVCGFAMIGAPPLLGFPGRFFMELIAYQFAPFTGTALVAATLLLIVGQLRAVIALFGAGVARWTIESRPVAGLIGPRRSDHRADDRYRVRTLEHEGDDRRRHDHLHEIFVEELSLVDRVMLLGHRALHLQETERDDAQAAALEPRDELAGDRAL